jgi:hypothetical protein
MLEIIFIVAIALGLFTFGVYAMRKSDAMKEKMLDEFQTDEHGELEIYESESNLSHPTIPFPSSSELSITANSKLERVYLHLITHGILSVKDYGFLKITRSSGYIYKLRKMGFTISTEKDNEGKFSHYKLICYKIK